MQIEMAVLCDFAADYGGKFFIQACYDTVEVDSLPHIKRELVFALRISMEADDEGSHQFGMNIVNADGIPIVRERMPFFIDINVKLPEHPDLSTRNYVFNCFGLQFDSAEEYSFDLTIDGKLSARVPFRVVMVDDHENSQIA